MVYDARENVVNMIACKKILVCFLSFRKKFTSFSFFTVSFLHNLFF
jgi:hypothetical protein